MLHTCALITYTLEFTQYALILLSCRIIINSVRRTHDILPESLTPKELD